MADLSWPALDPGRGKLPPALPPGGQPPGPSRQSLTGLDWLNFFIANVQTGFGPFLAVYLTSEKWTQVDIGLVLTISGFVALIGQAPAGMVVDAMRAKRFAGAAAAIAIAASAAALALWPGFAAVLLAEILHGVASCLMSPAIAALSLGLVAHSQIGERLGRNARFASLGNGIAAALMGACGRLISTRAVFVLTALLTIPALIALARIRPQEIDPLRARGGLPSPNAHGLRQRGHGILDNRPLLVLAGALVLFHLANAALLPLIAGIVTTRSNKWATVLIAACIVVPQGVVALISPWIGRKAEEWGRRPLLLLGFLALPLRALLFAATANPYLLVLIQVLDGLSAAVIGVLLPLVVADTTRGSGRFNAALGVVGTAAAIGGSLSTSLAGYLFDHTGAGITFAALSAIAGLSVGVLCLLLPETRPANQEASP